MAKGDNKERIRPGSINRRVQEEKYRERKKATTITNKKFLLKYFAFAETR